MTYRAKMENGEVVFENGIKPAEGVELRVEVVESVSRQSPAQEAPEQETLSQFLLRFSGIMPAGLPKDGSIQVDHYVYGTPKE